MNRISILWAGIIILLVTAGTRFYKIDSPIADWHSFRQVDTASVARHFVANGIDILHPTYHDVSNIQSGKDNPKGWRMVEMPLYQAMSALFSIMFSTVSLDVALRLVTIISATFTNLILMLLVANITGYGAALVVGIVYALMPYSIFYGRTVLPETFATLWAVLSCYLVYKSTIIKKNQWQLPLVILGSIAGAIAVLSKPTAGFLLLPVPFLFFMKHRISITSVLQVFVYTCVVILPFLWWRQWIYQYPEGIPVFDWLLNKDNIRFKGAWFHWLFAERLGRLMLGYWGIAPFILGILASSVMKGKWIYMLLGFGSMLYLILFAAGNVQHDYYQIILLPIVSIYAGLGFYYLLTQKTYSQIVSVSISVICLLFMIAFSWYTIRTYYWINRPDIITAGAHADKVLPGDAKVIAPFNGDTTFLYQTKRSGWPLGFDIDKKIAQGATHYVTVSPTDADFETKELAEKYTVIERNDTYAIIDLTRPQTP